METRIRYSPYRRLNYALYGTSASAPEEICEVKPWHWAETAACQGTDPEEWFRDRHESTDDLRVICEACPVRVACLERALKHHEWGFWGGTTQEQRRDMLRRGRTR